MNLNAKITAVTLAMSFALVGGAAEAATSEVSFMDVISSTSIGSGTLAACRA